MKRKGKEFKTDIHSTVVILPGIYNEALQLLIEAHDYFYRQGLKHQEKLNERERIMYASEMSRITIRLSCVMAWLMARKAVFMGKITQDEANESFRLDCRDVCLNQFIEAESILPKRMGDILGKSFELYQRVARLDDLGAEKKP